MHVKPAASPAPKAPLLAAAPPAAARPSKDVIAFQKSLAANKHQLALMQSKVAKLQKQLTVLVAPTTAAAGSGSSGSGSSGSYSSGSSGSGSSGSGSSSGGSTGGGAAPAPVQAAPAPVAPPVAAPAPPAPAPPPVQGGTGASG
ncbi:hypothetical protein BH10ACT8_BH10ACT8_16420 [soil metagenome]